jgi:hypothetical protein
MHFISSLPSNSIRCIALGTGRPLRALPETSRRNWHGAWGDKLDARLHLNAWRRVLDREEPDYRT